LIGINRAVFDFIAQIGYLDGKFYCILAELILAVVHFSKLLCFFVDMFAFGELDMFSLRSNSIFARVASNRYVALRATSAAMRLPRLSNLVLPSGKTYRIPAGDISSRRRRHIERRVSGAYRR
jgi:hypothetical protein